MITFPSFVLLFLLVLIIDLFFYQVTRLREYQGVDPHFDTIARQYHDIVKVKTNWNTLFGFTISLAALISSIPLQKLENMQWTIHQVEMDLKRLPDHPST